MNDKRDNKAPPVENNILKPLSIINQSLPRTITIPNGYVYIIPLNADGTEKEASGFFYPVRNYKRIYGDNPKYSIQKIDTLTINNYRHYETLNRTSQQITRTAYSRCNSCGK